jgi:hypothetical protein
MLPGGEMGLSGANFRLVYPVGLTLAHIQPCLTSNTSFSLRVMSEGVHTHVHTPEPRYARKYAVFATVCIPFTPFIPFCSSSMRACARYRARYIYFPFRYARYAQ